MSSKISLALESERVLKSIMINKKYIKEEIKKNGHYSTPIIYFRFLGFIKLKIRKKNINYENLMKDGKYISLFDLYFHYSSPLLLVNDVFYDFRIINTNNYDTSGFVKLNHRPIPPIYINQHMSHLLITNYNPHSHQF